VRRHVVIVGAGPAASSCVAELRRYGFGGQVTVIGDEPSAPYDRTLLSKEFLDGAVTEQDLLLDPAGLYGELDVELRLGVRATRLMAGERRVVLSDGASVAFSELVIATGGAARVPPPLAADGVVALRTIADARRLRETLRRCSHLAIVGGGFIAGEVATAARAQDKQVTMLEAAEAPMARLVGAQVGRRLEALHRAAGVDVLCGAEARRIDRVSGGYRIAVRDGRVIEADAVVVAVGMKPAVDWLVGVSGIELADGVITDPLCRTGVPDVLAVGDCARWLHATYGRAVRVEHWDIALRHGVAAARTITGSAEPFVPVPFVWSVQHGSRLQWVGEPGPWHQVEIDDLEAPTGMVARYYSGASLRAVFAINAPRAVAMARRTFEQEDVAAGGDLLWSSAAHGGLRAPQR
jgi:3-phenylpropionate/trans-cinnamate dioxygenase ferredoxin reductase subunit